MRRREAASSTKVDRLVEQESVENVAVGQHRGADESRVRIRTPWCAS